jgi:hypothetical protein
MQTTNNTNGFHIKVATQKETRRFLFEGTQYEQLATFICQIFGLSKDSVVIKYSDDEGDFVTISSDEELNFARQLAGTGPLRLVVSENAPQLACGVFRPKNAEPCSVQPSFDRECATRNHWREKWIKKQEILMQNPEWVQQQISKLTSKRQCLQTRLSRFENCENSGPKSHKLVHHREKLQEKINWISKQLEKLNEKADRAEFAQAPMTTEFPNSVPSAPSEEVIRELDELHSAIPALRFAHRQANLQLQLRRNDVQSAYHQFQNGDTSVTQERIDELKTLLRQAKEFEQTKKAELKAHMQKVHASRQDMKAFKKNRRCDRSSPCNNKAERKQMKEMIRQKKAAWKTAKKVEGAPVFSSC